MSHLVIAPILLPVLAGALLLIDRGNLARQRVLSLASAAGVLVMGLMLMQQAAAGPMLYALGDWPAPFGIFLMADALSSMMVTLLGVVGTVVLGYAVASGLDARGRHFHALWQFQLMGLAGAFLTADAFNLFVFFEVLLIASYGLMVHGGGGARTRAGVQYVAFNLVGSTLFLFALGLLYSVTGTLNMADLAVRSAALPEGETALLRLAIVMLIAVFAIKGSLVPLQAWLPGTYANAPLAVAALFAVMTKVGAYATLRFSTLAFPAEAAAVGPIIGQVLLPAGLATVVVGAVGVLGAASLARLVAFAGIASMGVIFAALSVGTAQATAAALYYLLHSTLATAGMFLVADLVLRRRGAGGLARPLPLAGGDEGRIAALFMAGAVAMAGLPPLAGFFGKLMVLQVLAEEAALAWSVILGGSFLMVVGFARAGSMLFWRPHDEVDPAPLTAAGPALRDGAAVALAALVLAGTVALTVAGGPVQAHLAAVAASVHAPAPTIAAHALPEVR